MKPIDEPLLEAVFDHLAKDEVPGRTADLILGACAGDDGLRAALAGDHPDVPEAAAGEEDGFGWCRLCWFGGCGDLLEAGPVAGHSPGGVLGEVMPQMPPVSDLHYARGALTGAFGIGA